MSGIISLQKYGLIIATGLTLIWLLSPLAVADATGSPTPAYSATPTPTPVPSALVQCNVGLIGPLLLAGTVMLYCRINVKNKR